MLVLMVSAVENMWNMYCFLMSPPSLFSPHPWKLQSAETPSRLTTWTVGHAQKRSMGVDLWLVGLQYHAITYCAWWVTCQWLLNHSGGPCAPCGSNIVPWKWCHVSRWQCTNTHIKWVVCWSWKLSWTSPWPAQSSNVNITDLCLGYFKGTSQETFS